MSSIASLRSVIVASCFASLAACGSGGGGLDRADVENLPPGDATGSALSGTWSVTRRITSCSGQCSSMGVSVCDVGYSQDGTATLTQAGGALSLDISDTPGHFAGGVYADGTVELGGYATQQGGALQFAARLDGTYTADAMQATAKVHLWGSASGYSYDCSIVDAITSTRANPR